MLHVPALGLVFLHNPGTGGSAVRRLLLEHHGGEWIGDPWETAHNNLPRVHSWLVPEEYRGNRVFCVYRDAAERQRSAWRLEVAMGRYAGSLDLWQREHPLALPPQWLYVEASDVVLNYRDLVRGLRLLGLDADQLTRENEHAAIPP